VIVARHHRRLNSQLVIPLGEQFVELLVAHRR
jgi:hypothetical protein